MHKQQLKRQKLTINNDIMDVYFDTNVKRYRNRSESGKGRFVSRQVFIDIQKKFIVEKTDELVSLAQTFYDNPNKENLQRASLILKEIHIANGIIGANGVDKMAANDYLAIGRTLQRHYGLTDNESKAYGLIQLFAELKAGDVVSAELLSNRLRMYAQSGDQSRTAVEINKAKLNNKTEARRHLGATDQHCVSCLYYVGLGWQSIVDVVLPGTKCECLTNCKCTLEYR